MIRKALVVLTIFASQFSMTAATAMALTEDERFEGYLVCLDECQRRGMGTQNQCIAMCYGKWYDNEDPYIPPPTKCPGSGSCK